MFATKIAIVALLIVGVVVAQNDHCAQFPTCEICVAQPLCGWCSENTIYPGPDGRNHTGAQCAGFNPNGKDPFECPAIYSTETCTPGYVCNQETFECQLGKPGAGTTKDQCEANCTNNGKVFLCNHTTKQCHVAPDGTAGAASLNVCEASCAHPTAHPSSPNPAPHPKLYSCNYTTGTCDASVPGKGTSKEVCEKDCTSNNNTQYMCNQFTHQCVKLPPSVHGESLKDCMSECSPTPKPNPPPTFPTGLWRGIQIDNSYKTGEFDLFVNETVVNFVSIIKGSKAITITGKPFHLPNQDDKLMLWIQISSGQYAGKYIKTLADTTGAPGPETVFMTMAMSSPGGKAPTTIKDSFAEAGQSVFAFDKCNDANCHFSLPTATQKPVEVLEQLKATDRCSQYKENCTYCLDHPYCGWCSEDVTYQDGSKGTQCAGFNSPSNNNSASFVCSGHYSTLSCNAGYKCDSKNYQCVPAAPGDGVVTKAQCEELCHPTPPPTPPVEQYVCNTTLKQCFKCDKTHCPGSLPKGPCEASCIHPKHGPHSQLIGVWRGIRIENGYKTGEVEMTYTKTNVSFYVEDVYQFTANITSLGADLMLMKILDGKHKDWKFGVIYQYSNEYEGVYSEITMAQGVLGRAAPNSYDEAMYTQGMTVYTLAQCKQAPCKFNKP